MKIKALSWNIWQGYHLEIILKHLKREKPDILALQEVIEKDGTNTAEVIAKELGNYEVAYFRAIDKTRLGFPQGNAILSKFPIKKSEGRFLSTKELYKDTAETEPRIAVKATINCKGTNITVVTAHLAYSRAFRESKMRDMQVKYLLKLVPNKKAILMGDFNSRPESSYMKNLNKRFKNADPDPKEPTWTIYPFDYEGFQETKLRHRLDHIFVTKDLSVSNFKIENFKGSDHLPVAAVVEV